MDMQELLYGNSIQAQAPQPAALPAAPAPAPQMSTPMEAPTQTPLAPEQQQVMQQEGISGAGGGAGFFDKLRSDPALHQAMLMMGARLMQGPKQGQNELGVLGDATAVAAQVHNMLQTNERTMQTDEAKADALINRENAGADAVRSREKRENELHPDFKAKLNAEVIRLRNEGEKEAALALIAKAKSDPKYVEKMLGLDLQVKRSQVDENKAQAANAYASADSHRARAAQTRDETANPEKYRGGKGGENPGTVAKSLAAWKQHYTSQGMAPEEAAKAAEQAVRKEKGKDSAKEFLKFATDAGYDLTKPAEYEASRKAFLQAQTDFSGEAKAGGTGEAPAAPPEGQRVHGQTYVIGGKARKWFNDGKQKGWEN